MSRRTKVSLLFCTIATAACVSSACARTSSALGASSAPTVALALALHPGEGIVEHRYENDQIEWKLPHKRLERFRRGGVIIKEERHITSKVRATVISVVKGVAFMRATSNLTSVDIPRHKSTTSDQTFTTTLTSDNRPLSGFLDLEDAATVKLPSQPVHLGQHWQTRVAVITTLGSGSVTFDHEAQSVDNGLVRISIQGRGEITGTEYHLPKLLPGTIELRGSAWFDLRSGLITQESYLINDRILKPAEGEQIGFDERRTVDISARRI